MRLIVNADDFGASHNINSAIMEAFESRLITNTTLMANMPAADEAAERIGAYRHQVGLHLNFTLHCALSRELKEDPIFSDKDGMLSRKHMLSALGKKGRFFLPKATEHALQCETERQIQKYLELGFTQMHVDSHCHVHTIPSIYRAVLPVLKEYGFRTMRKSMNVYASKPSMLNVARKRFFNAGIDRAFLSTDYFASFRDYVGADLRKLPSDAVCELMVHPYYTDDVLVDKDRGPLVQIEEFIRQFECISYSDLR